MTAVGTDRLGQRAVRALRLDVQQHARRRRWPASRRPRGPGQVLSWAKTALMPPAGRALDRHADVAPGSLARSSVDHAQARRERVGVGVQVRGDQDVLLAAPAAAEQFAPRLRPAAVATGGGGGGAGHGLEARLDEGRGGPVAGGVGIRQVVDARRARSTLGVRDRSGSFRSPRSAPPAARWRLGLESTIRDDGINALPLGRLNESTRPSSKWACAGTAGNGQSARAYRSDIRRCR